MAKRGRPKLAHSCSAAFKTRKPRTITVRIRNKIVKLTRYYPENQRKDWLCAISYFEGIGFLTCAQCRRKGLCERNNLMYSNGKGVEGNGQETGLQSSGNGMVGERSGGISRNHLIDIYRRSHFSGEDGNGDQSTTPDRPMESGGNLRDTESNARALCTFYNLTIGSSIEQHSILSGELHNNGFAKGKEIETSGAPARIGQMAFSRNDFNFDLNIKGNPSIGIASRIRSRVKTVRDGQTQTIRSKRFKRFNHGKGRSKSRIAFRGNSCRISPEPHKRPQTRNNFQGKKSPRSNNTGECAHLSQRERDKTVSTRSNKVDGPKSREKIGNPDHNPRYAKDIRKVASSTRRFDPNHNEASRSQERGNDNPLSRSRPRRDENCTKVDKSDHLHFGPPSQRTLEHKEPFDTSETLDNPSKVPINDYYQSLAARLREMSPDEREKTLGQNYAHLIEREEDHIAEHMRGVFNV